MAASSMPKPPLPLNRMSLPRPVLNSVRLLAIKRCAAHLYLPTCVAIAGLSQLCLFPTLSGAHPQIPSPGTKGRVCGDEGFAAMFLLHLPVTPRARLVPRPRWQGIDAAMNGRLLVLLRISGRPRTLCRV